MPVLFRRELNKLNKRPHDRGVVFLCGTVGEKKKMFQKKFILLRKTIPAAFISCSFFYPFCRPRYYNFSYFPVFLSTPTPILHPFSALVYDFLLSYSFFSLRGGNNIVITHADSPKRILIFKSRILPGWFFCPLLFHASPPFFSFSFSFSPSIEVNYWKKKKQNQEYFMYSK